MKRILITLIAASFLGSPMAFAQPSGAFEVAQSREHQVERRNDRTIKKTVIIKKQRFVRGGKLTRAERRQIVAARDYRRHNLRQPQRGQQWVRVDNNYLLVSLATGLIIGLASGR